MLEEQRQELIKIFGERVALDRTERMLYSSDLGVLPNLVKRQINTMPDAVVQPLDTEELTSLIRIATKYKIPLVPRGSGTAGYGGAVPTRGGIVVDFYRMNKILNIDKEKKTATIQAGVIWNDLEKELRASGLALRLYPGSAVSSTVGGWLAAGGGVGIGSYEYGYLRDSIVEVELVTPKGVRKLNGAELDLVDGMSGITGFISQVTVVVRDADVDVPVSGAFPDLQCLVDAVKDLKEKNVPLWEISYRDPAHIRLVNEAVEKQDASFGQHEASEEPKLSGDSFVALFVYPRHREADVHSRLVDIIKEHRGEVLEDVLAGLEWEERFYPIRLKALGPSLIPSEVDIPAEKLPALIKEIQRKMGHFAFNGTLVRGGSQATVLTYELDDERRRGFTFAYASSFVPIKASKKLDGKPYAAGMYLTDYSEQLLGKEKLKRIHAFKQEIDPDYILNPGKVFPPSLEKDSPIKRLSLMTRMAQSQTALIKVMDRLFGGKAPSESIYQRTVPGKLTYSTLATRDSFACANCGFCRTVCTQFKAIGWESSSPRGKFHFMREYLKGKALLDERMAEMFFACTTCRRCNEVCQVKAHIDEHWTLTARPMIWREGFNPPLVSQTQAHNILVHHNTGGLPPAQRPAWIPPGLKLRETGEVAFWAGCSTAYNRGTRNLAVNAVRIMNKAGIEPAYLGVEEWCCGGTMYKIGSLDEAMDIVKHNVNEINKRGIKTLVTSCSGCWLNICHLYPLFAERLGLAWQVKVKHVTELIDALIAEGKIRLRFPLNLEVTYHDSCHVGRGGRIYDPPRRILAAIPGLKLVEMASNRENSACCGQHVTRYPRLGGMINTERLKEVEQTGARALVCNCPTCENNFRASMAENGVGVEVLDITDLVAYSMGLPTLAASSFLRLKYGTMKKPAKKKKEIYLTKEELAREESLFKPHEESYRVLKGRTEELSAFSAKISLGDDAPKPPSSC
ncbi:MAG: FAD-binding and (Fe-S)-binding domain-containing protein [Dehalococcoidia bacterium]|nr:FAD-binding and (Fe-S)-binding domain-containing protein [Dehalococcoidia bacterium]